MKSVTAKVFALIFAAIILLPLISIAEVPTLISHQGILLDSYGNPFMGTVNVNFTIFDLPADGTQHWQETQTVTFDEEGLFNVLLGEVNAITNDVFDDPVRWLEIQVEGDQPMIPRIRMVSVPYANRVSTIDGASGGIISGNLSIQSNLFVNGNAGIGVPNPSERLQADGVIHSTSGGYKFPDGTVQTTAAVGGSGNVPIGTILAWQKDFPNTPPLPDGFVECNGQTLNDPESPYDGQTIPDLNGILGSHRFLRGSSSSGATGGSEVHTHIQDDPGNWGWLDPNYDGSWILKLAQREVPTLPTSTLPSYYEVVWIMRVK